jgi:Fic family protein
MSFRRDQPYNDLPLLPPATELETQRVLKRLVAARAALGELRGLGALLPNPAILISSLGMQEAKASSEIENVVTTHDELYRALGPDDLSASPAAKEVLRYREALWRGYERIRERPFCTSLFIEVCQAIRRVEVGLRQVPGVRVARGDGEVVYTPPEGVEVIRAKLANLEVFLHAADDLDPLVKLAVMHYQFEAIHPFTDGNGRTGRILNILFLVERGLLDLPILYLSRYILEHRTAYYEGLRRVTEEAAWEDWLLYMLDAVAATASDTRRRIVAIRECMDQVQGQVQAEASTVYSKDLIEWIFTQPYCRIQQTQEALGVSRPTATRYLRKLGDLGILVPLKMGRELLFINRPLFGLLSEPAPGTG